MKLTGLAFGLGFGEKKIQLPRCLVALHLPRPQGVITRADPRGEPGKFRRGKLLGGLFDFFNLAHGNKLTDSRNRFKLDSILLRLCRNRLGVALERGHDGVPGQDRALHPRRKFINPGEHRQLADVTLDVAGGDHFVDLAEHFFHVRLRFAFRKFGEQRRRRLGDAAAGADEADVLDGVAVQRKKEFQLVAAERVEALRRAGGRGQFVKIPRFPAVVKDDLLIEIV